MSPRYEGKRKHMDAYAVCEHTLLLVVASQGGHIGGAMGCCHVEFLFVFIIFSQAGRRQAESQSFLPLRTH